MSRMLRHTITSLKYRVLKKYRKPVELKGADVVDVFKAAKTYLEPWDKETGEGNLEVLNIWSKECLSNNNHTFRAEKLENTIWFSPTTYISSELPIANSKRYTHKSGYLSTEKSLYVRLNIPGHIQIKCTLPSAARAALWLLQDDSKFHKGLLPELDILETAVAAKEEPGVYFSMHDGPSYSAKTLFTSSRVYEKFREEYHTVDFKWNGKGTYKWYLDGVLIKKVNYQTPSERSMTPYIILWYAVFDENMDTSKKWKIKYLRIQN